MKPNTLRATLVTLSLTILCAPAFAKPSASLPDVEFMTEDGGFTQGPRCSVKDHDEATAAAIQAQVDAYVKDAGLLEASTGTVTIPVAFHVIHKGNEGKVSEADLDAQIRVLNDAYAQTAFRFSKASTDYTDVAVQTTKAAWYTVQPDTTAERDMKNGLAKDPTHHLNFYTANLGGGLLGWATFPNMYAESNKMHGVVCLYSSLPGGSAIPYNEGDTGTHEVGHWVGLYHTFQGGCSSSGDQVDDTNPERNPASGCPRGQKSCNSNPDPIENFMDYSDDACMDRFSPGQNTRMWEQMSTFRPILMRDSQ